MQVIDNSSLQGGCGPLGNGTYSITYSQDKLTYNEAYSKAEGDAVNSFASLKVNINEWNPNDRFLARIQVEAVKVGLKKLGYNASNVDNDVTFMDPSSEIKTKYAKLNNADLYTGSWEGSLDSRSGTSDARQSQEVDNTGFSLKYYKSRGNAIGFIMSDMLAHVWEAGHEAIEPALGDYNKMHEWNADTFLKTEKNRTIYK